MAQTDRDLLIQIKQMIDLQLDGGVDDGPTPPPSALSVKLLQWNSHHSWKGTDGVYNPDRAANWVKTMTPDICSFNEVSDAHSADSFRSRLQQRLGGTWTSIYDGRGNQIVTRFPIMDSKLVTIDATLPAMMVVCAIQLPNGRTLKVGSTHLHVDSQASRQKSAEIIVAEGEAERLDILLADCNFQAGSAEYLTLNGRFTDSWRAAKSLGRTVNYPGNCDGCTKGSRIDYAWLRNMTDSPVIVKAEIVDTRDAVGVMPSDHKPLVVTLAV